jgi:hypothetical protein
MNLAATIRYQQIIADGAVGEYFGLLQPIDTQHPPSLKNPKKVRARTPADGWHESDSDDSKKMAREDLGEVLDRLRRQIGRPAVAQSALAPVFPQGRAY